MKIVLNPDLVLVPRKSEFTHTDVQKFCDRLAMSMNVKFLGIDLIDGVESVQLGYIGMLADAYNRHEKVRLAPHDLWFIFSTELAKIVNKNAEACRPLFTDSSEKKAILVPTSDPTEIDTLLMIEQLRDLCPVNVDLFMPELSTLDDDVRIAFAASFADMVQQYYDYMTFMCGIPEIEVTGTYDDWDLMMRNADKIAGMFDTLKLYQEAGYIRTVRDIFRTISMYFIQARTSMEFWDDIFTMKNIGSGGQLQINGWITKMFFEKRHVQKIENFTNTYAVFPYSNLETGRKFKAAHGAFAQHRDKNGFMYASYTRIVFEVEEIPLLQSGPLV